MKYIAWYVSWFFYGFGNILSLPMYRFPKVFGWLYYSYNQFMHWSCLLSDKYDLGVWKSRQVRLQELVDGLQGMMEEDDEITIPYIIEMLLKDHDFVYVAMVAQQLQKQLWDQVTLGKEVGDGASVKTIELIKAAEAKIGNRTPGVILMNPRNMDFSGDGNSNPALLMWGKETIYEGSNVLEQTAKKLSLKPDQIRCDEPGIVDKSITPTLENTFKEVPLNRDFYKEEIIDDKKCINLDFNEVHDLTDSKFLGKYFLDSLLNDGFLKDGTPLDTLAQYTARENADGRSDIYGHMRNRNPNFCTDVPREPNNSESPCNEIELSESQPCTLTDEDYKNDVIFQIGRAYRHSGGREIFIVGRGETTVHGNALIAEESSGRLYPVGEDKEAAVNWKMIPLSEWMRNFS